ncbi:hypothetical protein ASG54_04410 [Aureimonas sp. Leaf460]|nr:hypothetical protein ASG54_04410 [Aureimonas sp. Leaf460]KQT69328.1 hypothetical protein ASG62_17015 [Aureimonas sp. Leaf427]
MLRLAAGASVLAVLLTAPGLAAGLKIGVTPGSLADSVEVAATEARAEGLEVEVIEFSDWTTPNVALASGDLDVNYFQHQAFLENAVAERHYAFADVGLGLLSNIGLYSATLKSLSDVKDGARVAVASDPVNQGRGLLLLEKAGLIKLKDGTGYKATLDDIVDNPKHLDLVEIEGPQLVRALEDVDLAQGYPGHFVNAGKPEIARSALLYSGIDDERFAIRFVTRADHAQSPEVRRFVEIYQASPAVRRTIHTALAEDEKLYSLPWIKD